MRTPCRHTLTVATLFALAGTAFAQPRLVVTAVRDDMAANGNVTVGWLYDGMVQDYAPFKYTRGVGFQRVAGTAPGSGGVISCSSDGSALAAAMDNTSNWGDLNCFTGYDSVGQPRVVQQPCSMPSIAHRYTAASGWVNAGSLDRTVDSATGRWIGGTRCDFTINSPNDLSADGRYTVGGAWSALTVNSAGNVSQGFCGDFLAFRADAVTGEFQALQTSGGTSRADRVSADGSVITGYDIGSIPDPSGAYPGRRTVAWYNGAMTVLDNRGNQDGAPVNGPGTVVAAGASRGYSLANFGVNRISLVKWTRSGSAWTAQNLGRTADREDEWGTIYPNNAIAAYGISDDGNTIVGTAYYSGSQGQFNGTQRPFIWRPTINGGVPMDLADYLATIDPTGAALAGTVITTVRGVSADGNTLLVSGEDTRTTCTAPNMTLPAFFSGMLSLDGAAAVNEPATIAMHPVDDSTRCTWAGWGTVFNVTAGGSWPVNYQWQREDANSPGTWIDLTDSCSGLPQMSFPHDTSWDYEGTKGAQLRVNVYAGDSSRDGRYRCIVSNAYGTVVSNPATFTFAGPINPQTPAPATGCAGSPATFSVGTVDGGVEYRWEVCTDEGNDTWAILTDGTNSFGFGSMSVSGSRTETVTIDPGTLSPAQSYLFRCHIADSCNALESNPATLTIGPACGRADLGAAGGEAVICGDGLLDNNDFVVFINYFFELNPLADQGRAGGEPGSDGNFDNNDFIAFINNFFDGCVN